MPVYQTMLIIAILATIIYKLLLNKGSVAYYIRNHDIFGYTSHDSVRESNECYHKDLGGQDVAITWEAYMQDAKEPVYNDNSIATWINEEKYRDYIEILGQTDKSSSVELPGAVALIRDVSNFEPCTESRCINEIAYQADFIVLLSTALYSNDCKLQCGLFTQAPCCAVNIVDEVCNVEQELIVVPRFEENNGPHYRISYL